MSEIKQILALKVVVDRESVSKLLRFREGTTRVDDRVEKLVDEAIREGYNLLGTAAVYRNVKLEAGEAGVSIDGGRINLGGASIAKHLRDSSRGTILAVTIGDGISTRIKDLSEAGEMARAAILDAFGSEAVERLADLLMNLIASEARRADCSLTSRFSPGYGDLLLEHQKKMLEYVEAQRIGISLLETFVMKPEKSITAVIGWIRRKR